MKLTIEYLPTHENMDYVFELQIDIVQRLCAHNLLHLLDPERQPEAVTRDGDVFEIKVDDDVIFSKETLGRLPNGEEVVNYIVNNN